MIMGRPQALKQVNLSAVRKVIIESGSATRAEIVEKTKISVTTVRALLIEMQETGEIMESGYDESSGGRKAVRYQMRRDKYYGVCLCMAGDEVRWFTVDIGAAICETGVLEGGALSVEPIFALLDALSQRLTIKSIGIGVPGIPDGSYYVRQNAGHQMERFSIGRLVEERYAIPVVLENNLNAIAFGFARHYLQQFPEESCRDTHMAYLHFEKDCLSAGFICNGQLIRGWNHYSGELGLFPVSEGATLDDVLDASLPETAYAQTVAKVIAGISCVLNPQYIALGGSGFREACLPLIEASYQPSLPAPMAAKLLYAADAWHDYFEGMAAITAEHIFSDIHLVRA